MGQQGYDNFKQRIKEWMDNHSEEYDCFEEEMNQKDDAGYQKVLSKAFMLVPQYQKIITKKANQGFYESISDIEKLFAENKLAESLIKEFENASEISIIPAMLSWLYFGKSFERMVERGEELRQSPDTNYVQKLFITSTIKLLVSKSISLGFRTKSDWEEHDKLMKLATSDDVMDWAIDDAPSEKKKPGRKPQAQTLPEMLSITILEKPDDLTKRIEFFLVNKNSKRDIACLKIALEELLYIYPCGVKAFRDALHKEYGEKINIIAERGIQDAYKEFTEFVGEGTLVKDLTINRNYINEITAGALILVK